MSTRHLKTALMRLSRAKPGDVLVIRFGYGQDGAAQQLARDLCETSDAIARALPEGGIPVVIVPHGVDWRLERK